MHLLKVGRFHINLAYIQFIHEEREDFILHFSEGANIRTTSVAQVLLTENCCSDSSRAVCGLIQPLRPEAFYLEPQFSGPVADHLSKAAPRDKSVARSWAHAGLRDAASGLE